MSVLFKFIFITAILSVSIMVGLYINTFSFDDEVVTKIPTMENAVSNLFFTEKTLHNGSIDMFQCSFSEPQSVATCMGRSFRKDGTSAQFSYLCSGFKGVGCSLIKYSVKLFSDPDDWITTNERFDDG